MKILLYDENNERISLLKHIAVTLCYKMGKNRPNFNKVMEQLKETK